MTAAYALSTSPVPPVHLVPPARPRTLPAAPLRAVHPAPALWWARILRRGAAPGEHSLVAVDSDRFAVGTRVDLSGMDARGRRPAGWLVDLRYRAVDQAVGRIDVAETVADLPLPLWFTETHHAGARIPAVTLAVHTGGGIPAGAVLPPQGPRGTRVGSVRWQVRSGLVDTVDIGRPFRDRGTDRLLCAVAATLAALRGWPSLTGDLTQRPAGAEGPTGVERLLVDLPSRLI